MARIEKFQQGTQAVKMNPTEVTCFYQVITDGNGGTLIHLSTFGSRDRQVAGKSSQSLQLNKERAVQLINILQETFHLNTN